MNSRTLLFGFAVSLLVAAAAMAQEISLDTLPAVVVKTIPQAGDAEVDPATKEISVTFSKEMTDGSWSWSFQTRESFPEVNGKPKYLPDKRTCVLPVKLAPGKTYLVWINTERAGNFKDTDGRSATPYLLAFRTRK